MRNIDYARLRNFDIKNLLRYEITSTSLFLTKDGFMRKSPKSELAQEIRKTLQKQCPTEVPATDEPSMIAVDFMSFARKITKKLKLRNYQQFAQHLWNTFSHYGKNCTRLDIIFDLYLEKSIKHHE